MTQWQWLRVLIALVVWSAVTPACRGEEVLEREDRSAHPRASEPQRAAVDTAMAYGWSEAADVSTGTREAQTGGAPYIGGFFGGEQGTVRGHGYFAGNLMSSMMVFSR